MKTTETSAARSSHPGRTAAAVALGLTLVPAVGIAQSSTETSTEFRTPNQGLTEVTVTAERFGATVQTTPVAITAITPEVLEERQVANVLQAASEIPGILIMPNVNSNNSARIVLRGAGQENGGINFDQAVGIYIDGVYQPRVNGAFFEFFDVGRVEVLRGPQGTLYGRNTSGGAIKIESRRPSFTWRGSAQATAGNYSYEEFKAQLSGPIVADKLAFSVSGVYKNRDGYLWGTEYGRRIGEAEVGAQRLKFLYTPTDNLDVSLAAYFIQDYSQSSSGVPLLVPPSVTGTAATGGPRDLSFTENVGEFGDPFLYNDGASLNVEWRRGASQVSFISGIGNLRTYSDGGANLVLTAAAQAAHRAGTPPPPGTNVGRARSEWFSHELNATHTTDRFKAVAGLYYYDEQGSSRQVQNGIPTIDQDRGVEASAVFGQGTYTLGRGVGVTLGVRYTEEKADFTQYFRLQLATPQSDSTTFKATTPKIGVNWQITPDLLTYASWTKGFKSGGFNPVAPANSIGGGQIGRPVPYGHEKVDSYEVGAKFTSEDRTFRLNVAAFLAEYDGLQLPQFFPGTTTSYTSNASGAEISGLELEPTWQPLESLQLYGNLAFNHGEYTEPFVCSLSNTQRVDCSDRRIKALPPRKWTMGFRFSPRLAAIPGQLTLNGAWLHHSKYWNNLSNELELVQAPEASLYNASLNWISENSRWRASLEGRNLADKRYVVHAIQLAHPTTPTVMGYPNPPRTVNFRVGVEF